jgi:hypothetical protein
LELVQTDFSIAAGGMGQSTKISLHRLQLDKIDWTAQTASRFVEARHQDLPRCPP